MYFHLKKSLTATALLVLVLFAPLSVGAQDEPKSGEEDYRAIQGMLNKAGLDAGPEDGQWGPASRRAMRAFQASVGLPETGMPDPATLDALDSHSVRNLESARPSVTMTAAELGLSGTCSVGLELRSGQGCEVLDAGTFSVRADGCVDEFPLIPGGGLSIGSSKLTLGGNGDSCISGYVASGGFRASAISASGRWRIDALPGMTSRNVVGASQEVQRAEETRDRLFASITAGDPAGVMRAIEDGADVNDLVDGSDLNGASALIITASHGNAEIVQMLVEAGADVNHVLPEQEPFSETPGGMSALHVAVNKEYVGIVRMLVEADADVNHVLPEQGFRSRGMTGASALITAVLLGNAEIVQILVEAGADVNHVLPEQEPNFGIEDMTGASALILAAAKGDEEIVRMLLEGGANVQYQIAEGRGSRRTAGLSALRAARAKDHTGVVDLLNKAAVRSVLSRTNVKTAITEGDVAGHGTGTVGGAPGGILGSAISSTPKASPAPSGEGEGSPTRIRVGGNAAKERLTHSVRPSYPELARQARVQGTVKLSAVIAGDGTIQSLKAMSGHPLLVPAAMDAVMQWRYRPMLVAGEAVEVLTNIDVNFHFQGPPPSSEDVEPGVYRIGGDVISPRIIRKVEPSYTEKARKAGLQGTVLLGLEVWEDGMAHNIRVLRGPGMGLEEKAIEAVKQWVFEPGRKNGKPVKVEVQVFVSFQLL